MRFLNARMAARLLRFMKSTGRIGFLMDWEMPGTDGLTAIREIIGGYPDAHICMVTAFKDDHLRDEAFAAGASGFVLKENLFSLEGILGG